MICANNFDDLRVVLGPIPRGGYIVARITIVIDAWVRLLVRCVGAV
jgi:glycosyltransferase A (GT-A) superfamily protein (DUF2064 family)